MSDISYSKDDPYYFMANSLAWKFDEDPREGESMENFIDRCVEGVKFRESDLSAEIESHITKSATVFTSESLNRLYFKRKILVEKLLEQVNERKNDETKQKQDEIRQKRLAKEHAQLIQDNEIEKVRRQIVNGESVDYDTNLLSATQVQAITEKVREEVREANRTLELLAIREQLIIGFDQLVYDENLVTPWDVESIREEVSSVRFSWLNSRVRPPAQPYGVSDYGAERLVGDWLTYLGCQGVVVTQGSKDGGVDVETESQVCQVKCYKKQAVSVQEVREIFGVASAVGKKAMVFTSSDLTAAASEFANQVGVIAVRFNVEKSLLSALNYDGKRFLEDGEYET
jgi:hypothetical protein